MKNNWKSIILTSSVSLTLLACQVPSPLAPHYKGEKALPIKDKNSIQIVDLNKKLTYKEVSQQMKTRGYSRVGYVLFRGDVVSTEELQYFAASVGSDYVHKSGWSPSLDQRSHLVVNSYTPSSTITTSGYGSSTSNYNFNTSISPYSNSSINTTGSSNTYSTATATTYVPSQTTYARENYEVLVADQLYIFWLSRERFLYNWGAFAPTSANSKKKTKEEIKASAALYAQVFDLDLPKHLKPKNPIVTLSNSEKKAARAQFEKMEGRTTSN